jgi:tetratricopeptide (TPR) repeat protein
MPDLLIILSRWWKFILGLTAGAVILAFIITLLLPKQYLSTATALPANSLVADKARILNANIEALYPEIGLPDELDKLEGTAALDTLFIAVANEFKLDEHYHIHASDESMDKAVLKLRKNSNISRTGYGELRIKVWDIDRNIAAAMANSFLSKLQALHQHLQNENNLVVLQRLKEAYASKEKLFNNYSDSVVKTGTAQELMAARKATILEQLKQYQFAMDQYELAIKTNPPVLLSVEKARPAVWSDRPKIFQILVLTAIAAFLFSFLLAVSFESRNKKL